MVDSEQKLVSDWSASVDDDSFVRNQVLQREIQEMYQTPVEFVEEGNACIGAAMAIADR